MFSQIFVILKHMKQDYLANYCLLLPKQVLKKTHCRIFRRKAETVAQEGENTEAILSSCGHIRVCK